MIWLVLSGHESNLGGVIVQYAQLLYQKLKVEMVIFATPNTMGNLNITTTVLQTPFLTSFTFRLD
jgi:hypothetical protein